MKGTHCPTLKTNQSPQLMWRGAIVLEEKKNIKKNNLIPNPSPLYYIKWNNESKEEVLYWSATQF